MWAAIKRAPEEVAVEQPEQAYKLAAQALSTATDMTSRVIPSRVLSVSDEIAHAQLVATLATAYQLQSLQVTLYDLLGSR